MSTKSRLEPSRILVDQVKLVRHLWIIVYNQSLQCYRNFPLRLSLYRVFFLFILCIEHYGTGIVHPNPCVYTYFSQSNFYGRRPDQNSDSQLFVCVILNSSNAMVLTLLYRNQQCFFFPITSAE